MASENIYHTPEYVELKFGDAIDKRIAALPKFEGLGAPDLVYLVKEAQTTSRILNMFMKPKTSVGSFHWILTKISSMKDITNYCSILLESQEKAFALSPTRATPTQFQYCTYNPFRKVDLHVVIDSLPVVTPSNAPNNNNNNTNESNKRTTGLVIGDRSKLRAVAYFVDSTGNSKQAQESDLSAEFWQEIYVSSVLRALDAGSQTTRTVKPLKLVDPLVHPQDEQQFLAAAEKLLSHGNELGSSFGSLFNRLEEIIIRYFSRQKRYDIVLGFFQNVISEDPDYQSIIAKVYRKTGRAANAVEVLPSYKPGNPLSPAIFVETVRSMIADGQNSAALDLAQIAAAAHPEVIKVRFALAHAHLANKKYADVLLTLNDLTLPNNYTTLPEDRIGKVNFVRETEPKTNVPHPDLLLEKELFDFDEEESNVDILLKRTDLTKEERKIYKLLVRIYREIGFRQMSELYVKLFAKKSKSFLLESVSRAGYVPPKRDDEEDVKLKSDMEKVNLNANKAEDDREVSILVDDEKALYNVDFGALNIADKKPLSLALENAFRYLQQDHKAYKGWVDLTKGEFAEKAVKKLFPSELTRIGLIAHRLEYLKESEHLFATYCAHKFWSTKVWLELVAIYTERKDVKNALTAANHILNHLTQLYQSTKVPTVIKVHIYNLISLTTSKRVREVVRQLIEQEKLPLHPQIQQLVIDATMAKVFNSEN
eukprot:TRINITY_DN3082_c0_g1_i1.p1 TRINITY_DN3082_c0_g1~~TRINITY_DN3082_c0_g1_i1.p1  ORF type:complete len:709 (-),score=261.53 TRINITY_DN3082_c0_g1_i1:34-2160(-)